MKKNWVKVGSHIENGEDIDVRIQATGDYIVLFPREMKMEISFSKSAMELFFQKVRDAK